MDGQLYVPSYAAMNPDFPNPPADAADAAADGLARIVRSGALNALATGRASPAPLVLAGAHEVYDLGLSDAAQGRLLEAARFVAWRFLVLMDEAPVGAVEVAPSATASGYIFASFNEGPYVAATVEGIRTAEVLGHQPHHTLRLVRVPSLYLVLLWLPGPPETLIALPPVPRGVQPYVAYDRERLRALVVPMAQALTG